MADENSREVSAEPPKKSGLKLACLIVAIIGAAGMFVLVILAILLFPALSAAREKARRTACLNNLKCLSIAMESYTDDYNGYLPATLEMLAAERYAPPGVFYCPSRRESAKARAAALAAFDEAARSGLNAQETAEAIRAAAPPHYVYVRYETKKDAMGAPVLYDEAQNHEDGRNVSFGDLHAEWLSEQDLAQRFEREAEQVPAFKEHLDKHGIDGAARR